MAEERKLAEKFFEELESLKKVKAEKLGLTEIRLLVEKLTQKSEKSLYENVLAIAVKIHHLRDEFQNIDAEKVPDANVRLEEVVAATDKATHDILDAAGMIQNSLNNPDIVKQQITKIFESCNFQDITGQHIKNVIRTLVEVETLVKAIIKILPEDFKKSVKEEANKVQSQAEYEKNLAHGPQLSGEIPTQDEIDKIFAGS